MTRFNQHTTGEEVVRTLAPAADGKIIVITGPSEGSIGAETVLALAHAKPEAIYLLGRTQSRVDSVISKFKSINSSTPISFHHIDLGDQESVRKSAGELNKKLDRIDVLFNNAGIMAVPDYTTTPQGIEVQFGTNHIGHFLLTALLWPKIKAACPGAVIVNTSSTGLQICDPTFEDPNQNEGKDYHPWKGYGGSKTANVLFGVELAKRGKQLGLLAFSLQPGMPSTNLAKDIGPGLSNIKAAEELNNSRLHLMKPHMYDFSGCQKTVPEASSTLLAAAFDPELRPHSGEFLRNCAPYEVMAYATDEKNAARLWEISEKMTGGKFEVK